MQTIAFFGSHPLGESCLERLLDHPDVEVDPVVTYPRGYDSWWDGSVHDLTVENDLTVYTLDEERNVLDHDVDYLLSVYYPNILGAELLDHPKELPLNLHQAELPRYRGSNVFSHSIMNARQDDHWKHGTTLHVMAEEVDQGDVIERRFVDIEEEDTARSVYEKTREESIRLFEDLLPKIVSGEIGERRTPQSAFDGERYFYTKESLDGLKEIDRAELVDPNEEAVLYDRIRALDFPPFEPAYVELDGHRIYLTKNSYEDIENLGVTL
ncbi:methionyl-tRNA formyltransferase [Halobacterium wangiae]|uniref:methionyl-tRNA formyltransferase n=1 Tax=Halobacterium wangiae TaxID=2902623 RepID=UPI001E61474F|nr:formyltransferase family protein [Halobacterium wangiae]